MKVYVVYPDWGDYEGCKPPVAAFCSRAKAAEFIHDSTEYWRDHAQIAELPLDVQPPKWNGDPAVVSP